MSAVVVSWRISHGSYLEPAQWHVLPDFTVGVGLNYDDIAHNMANLLRQYTCAPLPFEGRWRLKITSPTILAGKYLLVADAQTGPKLTPEGF